MIADDCCRTHKYRYDVTIYTGSRLGSGTTSSVCIMLRGTLSESDPHFLSYQNDAIFKRGSVNTFLVTNDKVCLSSLLAFIFMPAAHCRINFGCDG